MEKELIKLYEQYLSETIEERTIEMPDLESEDPHAKQKRIFKGDFDGFINWLKKEEVKTAKIK